MNTTEPKFQDYVRSRLNETTGTIIAVYPLEGKTHFDIRLDDDSVWYGSPAENWETVRAYED